MVNNMTNADQIQNQFLLNHDGTVPEGTDLEALAAHNIRLVIPQDPPSAPGMRPRELEPELRDDGKWYQRWDLVERVEVDVSGPVVLPEEVTDLLIQSIIGLPAETREALLAVLQQQTT